MRSYKNIRFSYDAAEASIPVVAWFFDALDEKLEQQNATLIIEDMKFGRAGLDISWHLNGIVSDAFENQLENAFDWVCLKASQQIEVGR